MNEKVVPFQDWRPLTEQERHRVPRHLWWLRVSRRRQRADDRDASAPTPSTEPVGVRGDFRDE